MAKCPACSEQLEPDSQNLDAEPDDETLYIPFKCRSCGAKWRGIYSLNDLEEVPT